MDGRRVGGVIAAAVLVLVIGGITVALALATGPTTIVVPPVDRVAQPPAGPGPPTVQEPGPRTLQPAGADPLTGWANRLAPPTGIPAVALRAYARAQLDVARSTPRCHLTWPTLAGIGSVESDHGRYGGAVLRPDGRSSIPIVGVPLDGSPGVRAHLDTDSGRLDGDRQWDRAIGPLQFIPATWRVWAADGDGDGRADPFDLDDAALAAARYLCADGGDLRGGPGWSAAIGRYNAGAEYLTEVYDAAAAYAVGSLTP